MLAFILGIALFVVAIPVPQTWVLKDAQLFVLRANCSDEPWHGRHLVNLPTGHNLGFENFTVTPETPGLKFLPVRLRDDDDKYALRGEILGEELSRTPYLAALTNKATRTASLKILYFPNPLRESIETQTDACPDGYNCIADQWIFNEPAPEGSQATYYDLKFKGFKGSWEPFKDAGKVGWHVYWKGHAGVYHSVQSDLVPVVGGHGRIE